MNKKSKVDSMKVVFFGFLLLTVFGIAPIFAEENVKNDVGQIKWYENNVNFENLEFNIQVTDQDMNANPDEIDKFEIRVWSNTDPVGIVVSLYETEKDSGVFDSMIYFSEGGVSSGQRLHVFDGDTVTAMYEDNTLPSSYPSNKLEISDYVTAYYPINNPLEKPNSFIRIEDETFQRQSLLTGKTISDSGELISTIFGTLGGVLLVFFIVILVVKKIKRKGRKKK